MRGELGTIGDGAVSTEGMVLIPRWRKLLRIAALAVAMIVVVAAVCVQIQQRVLRWRAERLLGDIRGLQLGKSTWADAQRIMTRWGAWGDYKGSCTSARCSYTIVLLDASAWFAGELPSKYWVWALGPYELLGGRYAMPSARIDVIDGLVWGKDFGLVIDVPIHDGFFAPGYTLSADADTVWRTDRHNSGESTHPEYRIGHPSGCEGCRRVFARFTPFADAKAIDRLIDFNLDCLTRRNPCLDQMGVMPSVWTRVLMEDKAVEDAANRGENPFAVCHSSPEFLGRDEVNVVVAQVESVKTSEFDSTADDVGWRLVTRLKRAAFWKPEAIQTANLPKEANSVEGSRASTFRLGEKYILAFPTPYPLQSTGWIDLRPCGPIPLTEQNLSAVRRGIRLDIFPESKDYWP